MARPQTSDKNQENHPHTAREMFSRITRRYDLLNHLLSGCQDVRWRRFCVRRFPKRVERSLDIATGSGDMVFEIKKRFPSAKVVGMDFVPQMLNLAAKKAHRNPMLRDVRFVHADALLLPFDNNLFDTCTIAFGLRNILEGKTALIEMKRVLKPGGRGYVLEMTFPEHHLARWFFRWYLNRIIPIVGGLISGDRRAYRYLPVSIQEFLTPAQLVKLLHDAGFVKVKAYPLSFGIACLHEGKKGSS